MRISEIQDKELRELAELRRSESDWPEDNQQDLLIRAFDWSETPEGWDFWNDVYDQRIKSIGNDAMSNDPIVTSVIEKYKERSEAGINKYGTTLENNNLTLKEWLNHLQEELMDATLYIEKLKQETK